MKLRHRSIAALSLCLSAAFAFGQTLTPHQVNLENGKHYSLNLPDGFEVQVAAEGLRRVRFMTKSPDGRIFATDMFSRADNSRGKVYILDGFDAKTGRFSSVIPYLEQLRNPNNVAFYTDAGGQQWLYLGLTDKLVRYRYKADDNAPNSEPETLATYPDYGLDYKYGGWHLTRTVTFGKQNGKDILYVAVGSSCNACEEKEPVRASLMAMDPDGKNQRQIAKNLRNAVGLVFANGTLYGTNMGADHLGDDAPDDTFLVLDKESTTNRKVTDFGWPNCYVKSGKVVADPQFGASPNAHCSQVPAAYTSFAAHSAALGVERFTGGTLANTFLVALHGAGLTRIGAGYRVVRFSESSRKPVDFVTGFVDGMKVNGRPCGLLQTGVDSFLLTDDFGGVVFYIHRVPATPVN